MQRFRLRFGTACALAFVFLGLAVTPESLADAHSTDGRMAPGILPSGFGEEVDRDIERLRAATERFKAAEEAFAAGYKRTDHCVEYLPEGGMGLHFNNPALTDTTLELEKPETLVYELLADGTYKLNGVEYIVPISAWKHRDAPVVMGQKLKRAEQLGIWYLHVWNWEQNPSGVFADWNPRVKCQKNL